MEVRLDYGRTGLDVELPDDVDVSILEPSKGAPLADPSGAVAAGARASDRRRRRSPSWRAGGATRSW